MLGEIRYILHMQDTPLRSTTVFLALLCSLHYCVPCTTVFLALLYSLHYCIYFCISVIKKELHVHVVYNRSERTWYWLTCFVELILFINEFIISRWIDISFDWFLYLRSSHSKYQCISCQSIHTRSTAS